MMMGYAISLLCFTLSSGVATINEFRSGRLLGCLRYISFYWVLCWCLVMAFDTCYSFLKLEHGDQDNQRAKLYAMFVALLPFPLFTWFIWNLVKDDFTYQFVKISQYHSNVINSATTLCFIVAAIKAFQTSRCASKADNSSFKKEMARWANFLDQPNQKILFRFQILHLSCNFYCSPFWFLHNQRSRRNWTLFHVQLLHCNFNRNETFVECSIFFNFDVRWGS